MWQDLFVVTEGAWASQAAAYTHAAGTRSHEPGVQQSPQASRAASTAAAVQLAAAVMALVSQHIPQLVAADHKAVLRAARDNSSATSMSVQWKACHLLRCAAHVFDVVDTIATYLPYEGGAAALMSSAACLPESTRLLTLATFIMCLVTLLHDRSASTAASTDSSGSGSCAGGVPTSSRQPCT